MRKHVKTINGHGHLTTPKWNGQVAYEFSMWQNEIAAPTEADPNATMPAEKTIISMLHGVHPDVELGEATLTDKNNTKMPITILEVGGGVARIQVKGPGRAN